MKTAAAAAMMLGLLTPANVAAEPTVLSDLELDAITAAGVLVNVGSFAAAFGDGGRTRTDAITFAFNGERFDLAFGITMAQALACCSERADVEVGSAVLGIGDLVHDATRTAKHYGRFFARGYSMGFVFARSFQLMMREQHLAMLREMRVPLSH